MKFRFCGDLDCPDWILAEISSLSKLTSVKMKLLCVQVAKNILGAEIDFEKVTKLTSDAKFEDGDIKATLAAVTFVLSSAAKHSVDGQSLDNELQQLGLPKEHSTSLCKVYADNMAKFQEVFREKSLRVSKLDSVEWRVDYVISSSSLQDIGEPSVHLRVNKTDPVTKETTPITVSLSGDKFRLLLRGEPLLGNVHEPELYSETKTYAVFNTTLHIQASDLSEYLPYC